ncbi:uncharacterized protein LOC133657052 isoform X3 [Entelurus aequoreus]|uniref:uncharacterized protein LOC133657052 isoform X3 n=1 Tax=Entelurus aequoreus TaxID=161455 RepID=UPI002B1CEFE8|nr:uncharacterized protein LOC133657052 isoform X3 [Entelurus aequoreus]
MALPPGGKAAPAGAGGANLYEELGDSSIRRGGYGRPELSMESGIDPGQDYYQQDYYNYDQGYDIPQYGSRRRLIAPMYDEYGEVIVEDDGYYYSPHGPELVRKKRTKPAVDRENETTSTGEESSADTQRARPPNSYSNINGNIYLAQNGTIVRTRRTPHLNNLKVGSQFKKLDKLGVTHEEASPVLSADGNESNAESGTGSGVAPDVDINLNTRSSSGSLGSGLNALKGSGSNNTRVAEEEGEAVVDNHRDSRETLASHSDHAVSDEEELWMGPWNNLHIPMTKL